MLIIYWVSTDNHGSFQVDEKTRLHMLKLRQTWDNIVPIKDLHCLDLQVLAVESDWPLTRETFDAKTGSSLKVLINPKFLPSVG